jgi:hypothetical protein
MKKRIIAFLLCLSLTLPVGAFFANAADSKSFNTGVTSLKENAAVEVTENIISKIGKTVKLDARNDVINYNKSQIISICKKVNIDAINAFYSENGQKSVTSKDLAQMIIKGIDSVNEALENGEYEILPGGTIVEVEDDDYYLQGGSTYDQTFWWGRRRYKSTAAANTWAWQLNNCAVANGSASLLAGAVFGGFGAIPNGLCSMYCWKLANDVSYVNSRTNRGIVANIWWILVYNINNQ